MKLSYMLYYCKPKTCTACCFASALINSEKSFKNSFLIFFWNTDTRIFNTYACALFKRGNRNSYISVFLIIPDCVVAKIINKFLNKLSLTSYITFLTCKVKRNALINCINIKRLNTPLGNFIKIDRLKGHISSSLSSSWES